ncbi:NUDIX hydrolase [Actinocorallia longicatena]|uniref:Nudix hydrolase domain-containing protein n=1 Tax=Actinocorallia longicatena TaxID=111803 RepID=A0ABP6Q2U9_9ACTN
MVTPDRRSRYEEVRATLPDLFANPSGAPLEIITDPREFAEVEQETAERLEKAGHPPEWGHLGVVYEDPYSLTLRDPVRTPDGRRFTYFRRINPGNAPGVVILPVHPDGVVLLRHFRHATRDWHWELPRGYGTPGERPDADARRELLEEIGAEAATLTSLGYIHPDSGQMATPVFLYHADVAEYRVADEQEGIESVRTVTSADFAEMIRTGEINDGFTLAAYTRALLEGLLA